MGAILDRAVADSEELRKRNCLTCLALGELEGEDRDDFVAGLGIVADPVDRRLSARTLADAVRAISRVDVTATSISRHVREGHTNG